MLLGRKAKGTVACLLGLPSVLTPAMWSWGQLCAYNAEFMMDGKSYVHIMRSTFTDHAPARNNLAAKFLGDWLLQLDADHEYEPDICHRLLRLSDEAGVDVISGLYQLKNPPYLPVLYQWIKTNKAGDMGLQPMAAWPENPPRLLQIGSAGAGCLFVRRRVFDRIIGELNEQPFDKRDGHSEDHSFFIRCRLLGIKCYAAMDVHCDHLRVSSVTLDDYDPTCSVNSELFPVGGFA